MPERDDPRPSPREVAGEDFLFHLHRGSELLQDNRVHAAKAELEQALSLQPSDPKGQDLLGIVYFRLGLYPRAIAIYERLIQLHPDAIEPRINLALCYLKTGQPALAKVELERALEHNPHHNRAWGYLGLALQRLGEFERAGQAFAAGGHDAMARRLLDTTGSSAGVYSFRSESPAPPPAQPVHDDVRRAAGDAVRELDRLGGGFRSDSELPRIPSGTWSAIEPGREVLHPPPAPPLRDVALAAWPGAGGDAPSEAPATSSEAPPAPEPPAAPEPPPADGAGATPRPRRASTLRGLQVVPGDDARWGRRSDDLSATPEPPLPQDDVGGPWSRPGAPLSLPQQDGDAPEPSHGAPLSLPQQASQGAPGPAAKVDLASVPPSSVPRFAVARPDAALAFARSRLLVFPRELPVAVHPSGAVLVQSAVGFAVRVHVIRALTAAAGIAAQPVLRRTRGRVLDEPLGGAAAPLVDFGGRCELVLAPPRPAEAPADAALPAALTALLLEEEPLYLREDALMGFELSLAYESGRMPAGDGEAIPMVQLRGAGTVVAALPASTAALEIVPGKSTQVHATSVLGWLGRVMPRALAQSEAPLGARGLVALSGEGMVFVDGR